MQQHSNKKKEHLTIETENAKEIIIEETITYILGVLTNNKREEQAETSDWQKVTDVLGQRIG